MYIYTVVSNAVIAVIATIAVMTGSRISNTEYQTLERYLP